MFARASWPSLGKCDVCVYLWKQLQCKTIKQPSMVNHPMNESNASAAPASKKTSPMCRCQAHEDTVLIHCLVWMHWESISSQGCNECRKDRLRPLSKGVKSVHLSIYRAIYRVGKSGFTVVSMQNTEFILV